MANSFTSTLNRFSENNHDGQLTRTMGYYGGMLCLGFTSAVLGPTLPGLAEQTRTTITQIGAVFAARSFGYVLGSFVVGRLYDRKPGHPLMAGALFFIALIVSLLPLMPALPGLVALLVLMGIAEGLVSIGTNTLLVWVHGKRSAPFISGLHFIFGVGSFIAPVIVAQAMLWSGGAIRGAYWTIAVLIALVGVGILRLPESPKPQSAPEAIGNKTGPASVVMIVLCGAMFFFHVGGELAWGGWVYTYVTTLKLAANSTAAYMNSAFWVALAVGRLLTVGAAARFSSRQILTVALSGVLAAILPVLLFPTSAAAVWATTVTMGFFMAPIFPTTYSLAGQYMRLTGKMTGILFIGDSTGAMFLPWLVGRVFEAWGTYSMPALIGVSAVMCWVVFAFVLYETRRLDRLRIA